MGNAERVERKLTAVLTADVQGYSCLVEADEEGIEVTEKAMRLNPCHPSLYRVELGWAHYQAGRYEEALASLKKVLTLNSNLTPIRTRTAVKWNTL
jgi:tetratricopeptide (TPR) repeat protein